MERNFTDFKNRLQKNFKNRQKWAREQKLAAFRVYERDIPNFPFIVDYYTCGVVFYDQSWEQKHSENEFLTLREILANVCSLDSAAVHFKVRQQHKEQFTTGIKTQYEKLSEQNQFQVVQEGRQRYYVNLTDYLDTGLFLDSRKLREMLGKFAQQLSAIADADSSTRPRRMLNLFCYTATASVPVALQQVSTVNVDLSNTYLNWSKENFHLNGISWHQHQFIREDCLRFLQERKDLQQSFDLIYLDPPSFSRSKKMEVTLDMQRDHRSLVLQALRFLKPQGKLLFSCNKRKFKLDPDIGESYVVEDLTLKTIPADFRDPHIHRSYLISQRS